MRSEPGKVAYGGYCVASDGKSLISGEDLPSWEALPVQIREAWRAAADAVLMVAQAEGDK